MAMTALFRGKWGQKAQEPPEKRPAAVVPPSYEDEDEDDPKNGFSRDSNRRNSRFYRSMRKKRVAPSCEHTENSPTSKTRGSSMGSPEPQKTPRATRRFSPPASLRLHSGPVLPSNGKLGSPHLPHGGRRDANTSPASTAGCSAEGLVVYRTHLLPNRDMESLSERTATACSVQEVAGDHRSTRRPSAEVADPDGIKLRMLSNGEERPPPMQIETICHSLNIVKNIAFFYQEYRDTSKQQEIEQRRQRDGLTPGDSNEGLAPTGSGSMSPPALQLQLRNSAQSLSLWQNLEAVQDSGLLTQLPQREVIMQEAMFELVSSEASYYKSLEVLETHFLRNPVLVNTLNQSDMHFLFSNIEDVMKASERFLMDLENRIEQSIQISDVCDIVQYHANNHFNVFIAYVINQGYQEKTYRRILQENQAFREAMAALENQPRVRGLSFTSFLILPFQRITRLKLLVQNILKKVEVNSEREHNAIKAHQLLEKIVYECNEGVRKMSRTEELITIDKTLEFKSKSVAIISHSRWLLRKGEVQQMNGPKSTRTMRSRKLYHPVYLFLFNNLLLITKRLSSGEKFQVIDWCTRAMLRTEDMEDQGQQLANVFNLKLLENQEERPVSYLLKTTSMSEKLRWICALTPNRRTRFMSTSAHQPDSPQVQCIQSYSSQEPDELSIEMADILNILEKTDDGWMMGERLHDGERGWFPCRVVEMIQSKEVRAQNLREVQRIHLAQGGGAPTGARMGRGTSRNPKTSSYTGTFTDQVENVE